MQLKDHLANVSEYFSPKVIGEVNDTFIKVAKIMGEDIPWHNHKNEDEAFYIIEGSLLFEEEGKEPFIMTKGELYIVKRGVNHRVSATSECHIMLVEPKATAHTGDVVSAVSRSIEEQMGNK